MSLVSSWHLFWRSPISTAFLFILRDAKRTLRWRHWTLFLFTNKVVNRCQAKHVESKRFQGKKSSTFQMHCISEWVFYAQKSPQIASQIKCFKIEKLSDILIHFCFGHGTELDSVLARYYLHGRPEREYNVDEKVLSTSHKPPSVVTGVEFKPQAVTSASRTTINVAVGMRLVSKSHYSLSFQVPEWDKICWRGSLQGRMVMCRSPIGVTIPYSGRTKSSTYGGLMCICVAIVNMNNEYIIWLWYKWRINLWIFEYMNWMKKQYM